jgi:hypothetical protein
MVAIRWDLEWHVPWLPLALTVLMGRQCSAVRVTAVLTRPRLILVRRTG